MKASATRCLLGQGWELLQRLSPCCHGPHGSILLHDTITPAMPPASTAATGLGFCHQLPVSHLSEITKTPIYHLSGPPGLPSLFSSSLLLLYLLFHAHFQIPEISYESLMQTYSHLHPNVLPWTALGLHSLPCCSFQLILMSALPCQHTFSNIWQILHRFTPPSPGGGSCLLLWSAPPH